MDADRDRHDPGLHSCGCRRARSEDFNRTATAVGSNGGRMDRFQPQFTLSRIPIGARCIVHGLLCSIGLRLMAEN